MNQILSLIMFLLLTPSMAEARCFIPQKPTVELGKAKAVFTGKVIGREYVKEIFSEEGVTAERLVIKIAVERVWKGDVSKEVSMYTSQVRHPNGLTSMMAEDFNFADDKRYFIYAFGTFDRLQTSGCTRTREVEKAGDDLKELGEGFEPSEKKDEKTDR